MCTPSVPKPPPPPPARPSFKEEQIALAEAVSDQRNKARLAGLAGTIATGAAGVLTPGPTTRG